MEKAAMSIKEFCEMYSVGRSFAYELLAGGDLKAVKAGKRLVIKKTDADAWLANLKPAAINRQRALRAA